MFDRENMCESDENNVCEITDKDSFVAPEYKTAAPACVDMQFGVNGELPSPYVNPEVADSFYMNLALQEAARAAESGEVPIGAVVVYEPINRGTRTPSAMPRIVARARNTREADKNPAGHAEFSAMLQAAKELDTWRLSDCTVYVTLEPCVMCAGLMHQARVARCVYGATDAKAGALGSLYRINEDTRLNHTYPVVAGVLAKECAALLKEFFAKKRANATQVKSATK